VFAVKMMFIALGVDSREEHRDCVARYLGERDDSRPG
jgi:hypothetical protein